MDQTTNQNSSTKWYAVGAVVIVAFAFWYFYVKQSPDINTQPTESGTTADISADFDQIQDVSAELDADASAVSSDLQAL